MPVLSRVTQFDRLYVVDLENDFNTPDPAFNCSLISRQMEVAGCFGTTQKQHTYMVSYTIYRSIFESLRFDPAFRLKRSEGRNAGAETPQQDPVKYYRTFGPIWIGLDARSGAPIWSSVPGAPREDLCPDRLLRWRTSGKFVPLSTCTGTDQHRGGPFEILKL